MNPADVHNLPLREKFQLLEALWEDLSPRIDEGPVSEAHRELLDSRIERLDSGAAATLDWDQVKHSIGKP